ncbi:MAG: acyl-CoA dehydrogenase family protein [Gammaproteobacteria bacterium]|nr:acyl-CoA dehydrogenase family protein [Gammaproteobacteria bacterium]
MYDTTFLDWPFFAPRHRELAHDLEDWAAANLGDIDHHDVDQACRDIVRRLAAAGWLEHAALAPDAGPDARLDVRSLCLLRDGLARHDGLADFAFAMQGLGSAPITLAGSAALKETYLGGVRSGTQIAAFALSEPEAGSDVAALATSATREGDEYVLNGTKTWISNGGIADFYTVFARTEAGTGARGLSAFVVDAATPGLDVAARIEVSAPHPLATLRFRDCRIPAACRLGGEGDGFRIAMATLDIFRATVGAAALGFARRALCEATTYAPRRMLFGAPLSALQMTQASIADMAVDIDASALLVYRAAWTKDCARDRVTREAAMAKLHATEAAQRVIDRAVQLFGGLGVTKGVKVEELYREIRALRIYEGASEVQKLIIAQQTLHAGAAAPR